MSKNTMSREKMHRFMKDALFKAYNHSKDDSTKVGALILGKDTYEVRSSGYNGMPRGCDDSNVLRHQRPEKYLWFEHAERNAIYNAARVGTPLKESILVVTLTPCMDCARAIVQSGIEGVVSLSATRKDLEMRWQGHFDKTDELFSEVGLWHESVSPLELIQTARPDEEKWLRAVLNINT